MKRFNPNKLEQVRGDFRIEELAVAAHVSAQTIRNWMAGRSQPTVDQLIAISELTGKPLDWFLQPGQAA